MSLPSIVDRLRAAGCVFAEEEAEIILSSATGPDEVSRMVAERVNGAPLEIVVGWAELGGIRFAVQPGVFVPRRRTEFLVELGRALAPGVLLDLCCGSGAVGAAIGAAELHATDIDPVAVECARRNVPGSVYLGDLFDPLPRDLLGRVDLVTLIAPYVPTDEIPLLPREARLYEPGVTLDGGVDGLAIVRRVAAALPAWLAPHGSLLTEVSERQVPVAMGLFEDAGLRARLEEDDERGATVVVASARP